MASNRDMAFLVACLKTIQCMDKGDFKIWGTNQAYFWNKFKDYGGMYFIGYLDDANLKIFCNYAESRNKTSLENAS